MFMTHIIVCFNAYVEQMTPKNNVACVVIGCARFKSKCFQILLKNCLIMVKNIRFSKNKHTYSIKCDPLEFKMTPSDTM